MSNIRDEKFNLIDYIDFDQVNLLLEGFNKSTGFVTAILDLEGRVLSQSGWRQICTDFHRVNPETCERCRISDTLLAGKMANYEEYHSYECLNGLVDVAVPLKMNGEHYANLFSGQFFLKKPDRNFFIAQADTYGFDKKSYLEALDKVPVVDPEKVQNAMAFLQNMTKMIGNMTMQHWEQKKLNATIQENEQRQQELLTHLEAGVVVHRADTSIVRNNPRATVLLGLDQDQLLGKKARDPEWKFLDEKQQVLALEDYPVNRILASRKAISNVLIGVVSARQKDVVWLLLNGFPHFDAQGELTEVTTSFIDITQMKNAEQRLIAEEQKFSNVFHFSPIGKSMTGMDGSLIVNRAFCDILGYSEEELLAKNWVDITHPDDVQHNLDVVKSLIDGTIASAKYEKRYIHKDGRLVWAELNTTLMRDENNEPSYFITSVQDINERKAAEEEILKYRKHLESLVAERTAQLEYSNQELRQFAQIVSHDLKAPLRAISQLSYWLSEDYKDKIDAEGQQHLEMLIGRVKRLDLLIDGILEYSRLGKQLEKEVSIDLQELVESKIDDLNPPEQIKISFENRLPSFRGDPTRIGQLFQNLIQNAIKFMDKPQGLIKIGWEDLPKHTKFFVADNGPGIEEQYFERIFQIFQRLTSRDEQEGTGIGLSLAKRVVQIYGGEIWLKSKLGEGTTFFFTLAKSANNISGAKNEK